MAAGHYSSIKSSDNRFIHHSRPPMSKNFDFHRPQLLILPVASVTNHYFYRMINIRSSDEEARDTFTGEDARKLMYGS